MNLRLNRTSLDVKEKESGSQITTELIPVLLKRKNREEIVFLPVCAICGEAITDLESANVATVGFESSVPPESLGPIGDSEGFRLPGVARVFHFECDQRGLVPWIRASAIFSRDQRHPLEKLGWSGVCE